MAHNVSESVAPRTILVNTSTGSRVRVSLAFNPPRMPEGHPAESAPTNAEYAAFVNGLSGSKKPQITRTWHVLPAMEYASLSKSKGRSSLIAAVKQFNAQSQPAEVATNLRYTVESWEDFKGERLVQAGSMFRKAMLRTQLLLAPGNPHRLTCAQSLLESLHLMADRSIPQSGSLENINDRQKATRLNQSLGCFMEFGYRLRDAFGTNGSAAMPELAQSLARLSAKCNLTVPEGAPHGVTDYETLVPLTMELANASAYATDVRAVLDSLVTMCQRAARSQRS